MKNEVAIVHQIVHVNILVIHRYLPFEIAALLLSFPVCDRFNIIFFAESFEFLRIDFEKVLANPSSLYVTTELVRVLSYEPQPIFEVVNTFLVLWLLILRFRPLSKNFIFRHIGFK